MGGGTSTGTSTSCPPTPHELLMSGPCVRRERERELYGPKKRGPKPKTFLLRVIRVLVNAG